MKADVADVANNDKPLRPFTFILDGQKENLVVVWGTGRADAFMRKFGKKFALIDKMTILDGDHSEKPELIQVTSE
jgi:hypothetical protein